MQKVNQLVEFLKTDTLLFASTDEKIFLKQKEKWLKYVDLFNKSFGLGLEMTQKLCPSDKQEDFTKFEAFLNMLPSEKFEKLFALALLLRSVILAFCVVSEHVDVKDAVYLAELEERLEIERWGETEEQKSRFEGLVKNACDVFKKAC